MPFYSANFITAVWMKKGNNGKKHPKTNPNNAGKQPSTRMLFSLSSIQQSFWLYSNWQLLEEHALKNKNSKVYVAPPTLKKKRRREGWGSQLLKIIIIKVFLKCKILSLDTILSAHTHTQTHTQRHPHTPAFWLYKVNYTQLKTGSKCPGDLEWIKMHGTENMVGLQMIQLLSVVGHTDSAHAPATC